MTKKGNLQKGNRKDENIVSKIEEEMIKKVQTRKNKEKEEAEKLGISVKELEKRNRDKMLKEQYDMAIKRDKTIEKKKKEEKTKQKKKNEAKKRFEKKVKKIQKEIALKPLYFMRKTMDLIHLGNHKHKVLCAILVVGSRCGVVSHVMLMGESGSGKSDLLNAALPFIYRDDYLNLVGATEAAIKNAGEVFDTKFALVFTEFDATKPGEDGSLAFLLRMMSSEDAGGDFLKCVKDGNDWKSIVTHIKPISIFTTYAKGTKGIQNENLNRLWVIEPIQDKGHVMDIINKALLVDRITQLKTKREYKEKTAIFNTLLDDFYTFDKEIQDLDDDNNFITRRIFIPFLDTLGVMFKGVDETRAPRDIKRFLSLIEIICKIHINVNKKSRASFTTSEEGLSNLYTTIWYIAEPLDFMLACELSWDNTQKSIMELTDSDIKIYNALVSLWNESIEMGDIDLQYDGFTPKELSEKSGVNYNYTRQRIYHLANKNYIKAGKKYQEKKRVLKWVPEIVDSEFLEWTKYFDSIEKDCNSYFKERNIDKDFEKEYSIYEEWDKRPSRPEFISRYPDEDMMDEEIIKPAKNNRSKSKNKKLN